MQFGLRTILFVCLLLGMLVLSYPLLFKPLNDQRDAYILETQQKERKLADLAGAMAHTKNMPEQMKKLEDAIDLLTKRLPSQTEMDKVLQEVWNAAKENHLIVKSVRNSKVIEGANYNEQPIKMLVEGPFYPGFFNFLAQVEQLPRLTKIKEMKITSDEKNTGSISADFELTIFYEPTEKVAGAE